MALIVKRLYEGYFWLFNDVADPRANYPVMNPVAVAALLIVYYQAVYNWGPWFMRHRKPYNIKNILIGFNVIQILVNLYIVLEAILLVRNGELSWRCTEIDYSEGGRKILNMAYFYYIIKLSDLLDTVFFVLRKKYNQVSFLHVYHHIGMVIAVWTGVTFFGGGHSIYLGVVNAFVHMFMYLYYLLTVVNPKFKSVLWMKKFVTQIQLAQFVFLTYMYGKLLFYQDCNYPRLVVYLFVPQNIFMMILFSDFYIRSYVKKPRTKVVVNGSTSETQ